MTGGRRRATLQQIAAGSGVSLSTASRALRGDVAVAPGTRERVLAVAAELGFQPNTLARSLKSGAPSAMLALVVPDVTDPFYADIAAGAQDAALAHGYTIMLGCHDEDGAACERILAQMVGFRPAAVIVVPVKGEAGPAMLAEARLGTPVVLLDRPAGNLESHLIITNNEEAMATLVAGLLEQGARSFAVVSREAEMWTQQARLASLRRVLSAVPGATLETVISTGTGERFDAEALRRALQGASGVTAVVGLSVPPLIRAIRATQGLPARPLYGCFDIHPLFDLMGVTVSAVAQDAHLMGRQAVLWALRSLGAITPDSGLLEGEPLILPASAPQFYGGLQ